jgi:hypothetical protein
MIQARLILTLTLALAGSVCFAPAARAGTAVELRGKWVLDSDGKAIPPSSFRRGLQPSALAWRRGELWSLGDQRSQYPGHLFRIDPRSGRLLGQPLRLRLPARKDGENPQFEIYRGIPNSDFEGLAPHPDDLNTFFAITEDKVPWVVEIRLTDKGKSLAAGIVQLSQIRLPGNPRPWRDDSNFRMEGLAVSDDARTLYLAFERADDDLPRIYSAPLSIARAGKPFQLQAVPVRFAALPPRGDKARARLNINDIQFIRRGKRPFLLAVARDQERLLVIDIQAGKVSRTIDLDFRDPDGQAILWVSPEGLAFDAAADRLWVINDPDSVRGNYRRRDQPEATGLYAEFAPLLFEMKLSELLGEGR